MAWRPVIPVKPGDIIELAEADYQWGAGRLRLRVTEVQALEYRRDKGWWVNLLGVPQYLNGAEDRRYYAFLVRVSALAKARRGQAS